MCNGMVSTPENRLVDNGCSRHKVNIWWHQRIPGYFNTNSPSHRCRAVILMYLGHYGGIGPRNALTSKYHRYRPDVRSWHDRRRLASRSWSTDGECCDRIVIGIRQNATTLPSTGWTRSAAGRISTEHFVNRSAVVVDLAWILLCFWF